MIPAPCLLTFKAHVMSHKRTLLTAVTLIGIGVVFGVVLMSTFGTNALQKAFAADANLGAVQPPVTMPPLVQALDNQFSAVAEAVKGSVVYINVKGKPAKSSQRLPQEFFRFFGPDFEEQDPGYAPEGAGSGVFVTADGYIVTNNHVVENAKEDGITVTTTDQKEHKATLIGRDPLTDLAVIKIDGNFTPAHFADINNLRVGQWVMAVGSPLGLRSTITAGIVSALGRGIGIVGTNQRTFERNRYAVENFIQTDAAINPGNSGGGLFDLNGSLVGINTAIASQSGVNAGYGFAIPIDMVKSVVLDLMDDGKIERGYIGIEITTVDETVAKATGLDKVQGVSVHKVVKGGAAAQAGIEVGDVILEVDGKAVNTSNDLQNQIVLRRAGDKVNLSVWRNGKKITKAVVLKALDENNNFTDASTGSSNNESSSEPVTFKSLGFTASALTARQKEDYGVDGGVIITNVDPRGMVARRGLTADNVIIRADGKTVKSPSDLQKILSSKSKGDGVLLVLKDKEGSKLAVSIEIPEEKS